MTQVVSASEVQKNFGLWLDRAFVEPVQITKHGRETAYLVSAKAYNELLANYRRVVSVSELTDEEMNMILSSEVPAEYAEEPAPDAEGPSMR